MDIHAIHVPGQIRQQLTTGQLILQLKTGQRIPATVVTVDNQSGQIGLNIKGTLVRAHSTMPLEHGQKLQLEVVKVGPLPQLRIIHPSSGQSIGDMAQLHNIARQRSLGQLSNQLISLSRPPTDTPFTGRIRDLALDFLSALPKLRDLSTPEGIRPALDNSGIFLESKLRRINTGPVENIEGDLKTRLLRFAATLESRGIRDRSSRSDGDPTSRTVPARSDQSSLLQNLTENLSGGLSKIIMNQVASLPDEVSGKQSWNFEIPFLHNERVDTIQLRIDSENPGESTERSEQQWSVVVELAPPGLGPIRTKIVLRGQKVHTYFSTDSMTSRDLIGQHLDAFREQLKGAGLNPGNIVSGPGGRKVSSGADADQPLLNTNV